MSQGANVQCSASSSPTSTTTTTVTTTVTPQWKLDLLQRRKTNNCPKTIGAQHHHHQQSLTQLKHGNFLFFFFNIYRCCCVFLSFIHWLVELLYHQHHSHRFTTPLDLPSNQKSAQFFVFFIWIDFPPNRLLKVNYMMKWRKTAPSSNFKLVFFLIICLCAVVDSSPVPLHI